MTEPDETLARRYLIGSLTEEERAMFEERILTDAALREDIELTQAIRQGMRELERRGEIASLLAIKRPAWFGPTFAFAASIAAAAFATNSLLLYLRLDQVDSAATDIVRSDVASAHETLSFAVTRSSGHSPDVTWHRPAAPTLLDLTFDVGLQPAGHYDVEVGRKSEGALIPVLVLPNTGTGANGRVQLSIHTGLLQPADYEIRLTPRAGSNSGDSWAYSMRVLD